MIIWTSIISQKAREYVNALEDILIPPSPNWSNINTFHSRQEDGLLVVACFKYIIAYQVTSDVGLPKIVARITYPSGKVAGVRLFSNPDDKSYGHTLVTVGECYAINLWDLRTGDNLVENTDCKSTITGLTWAERNNLDVIAMICEGGKLTLWDPKNNLTKTHCLSVYKTLTIIESLPHKLDQVIIAADKFLLQVSLQDGSILHKFEGHDRDVYTLVWYPGPGCPLDDDKPVDEPITMIKNSLKEDKNAEAKIGSEETSDDNWRKRKTVSSSGIFFATSDLGGNIFVWSLSNNCYILKMTVPYCSSAPFKRNKKGKQQVALGWYNNCIVSSTVTGELILWSLHPSGGKLKTLCHLHGQVIYNIAVINNVAVTASRDQVIIGFRLDNNLQTFQLPTFTKCKTMAINPHDVHRVALGLCNSIIVINLNSRTPFRTRNIYKAIQGQVHSLRWHPEHETCFLFGTSKGQVGIADVNSGMVKHFSYFHQREAYKVEWAPPMVLNLPEKEVERWWAYSLGDGDIVMQSIYDMNADHRYFKQQLSESDQTKWFKDITEFSFSFDHKYLAVGSQDGQVQVYDCVTMKLVVTYTPVYKRVQHILWKPSTDQEKQYVFAVGSNDHKVFIFHLNDVLDPKKGDEQQIVLQASKELHGHTARVNWLSWSPHKEDALASASYDKTICLWDITTAKRIATYGGLGRFRRVEFSLSDKDFVYSIDENNFFNKWRLPKLAQKPAENVSRKSKAKPKEISVIQPEMKSKSSQDSQSYKNSKTENTGTMNYFPHLDGVMNRGKGFLYVTTLSSLQINSKLNNSKLSNNDNEHTFEESLDDDVDISDEKIDPAVSSSLKIIEDTVNKYNFLLDRDDLDKDIQDINYILDFHQEESEGMNNIVNLESSKLESKDQFIESTMIHLWNGTLDEHIKSAAKKQKLDKLMVSLAPQVSFKLWEFACEAYAEQLVDLENIVRAASYYLSCKKIEKAVVLLMKHRLYKEALVIVKNLTSYDQKMVDTVLSNYSNHCALQGKFEKASMLLSFLGDGANAGRLLAKRTDATSLMVNAEGLKMSGSDELYTSTAISPLKEASTQSDLDIDIQDIDYILNFHQKEFEGINNLLNVKTSKRENRFQFVESTMIHLWNGMLEEHIISAAKEQKLNRFIVSLAPQVSFKLWEFACEAYAEQLVDLGDIVMAASYYLSCKKIDDIVVLLMKHKLYKEALVFVKNQMSYDQKMVHTVLSNYSNHCALQGNFEKASMLLSFLGDGANAGRLLAKRTDATSLMVSAEIFKMSGSNELYTSTAISALKEASTQNEFTKIESYLEINPDLNWYLSVHLCQKNLVNFFIKVKECLKSTLSFQYVLPCSNCLASNVIEGKTDSSKDESADSSENESSDKLDCDCEMDKSSLMTNLQTVIKSNPSIKNSFQSIYQCLLDNFSTKVHPSSLKHLWFLVSVSLCKHILSGEGEKKNEYLDEVLNLVISWDHFDQLYYITHLFLPFGVENTETLTLEVKGEKDSFLSKLQTLFCVTEVKYILDNIFIDRISFPWLETSPVTELSEKLQSIELATKVEGALLKTEKIELIDKQPFWNTEELMISNLEKLNKYMKYPTTINSITLSDKLNEISEPCLLMRQLLKALEMKKAILEVALPEELLKTLHFSMPEKNKEISSSVSID